MPFSSSDNYIILDKFSLVNPVKGDLTTDKIVTNDTVATLTNKTINDLKMTGDAVSDGNLEVKGNATISAVTITGNATIQGNLGVTGSSSFSSTSVSGNSSLATVTVSSTLNVTGKTSLRVLESGAATLDSATITNNASVGGALSVTSNTSLNGTLDVTGKSTLGVLESGAATLDSATITNNASVGGTLSVTSNTTLNGNLNATVGTTSLKSLNVSNGTTLSTLNVNSTAEFDGTVNFSESSTANFNGTTNLTDPNINGITYTGTGSEGQILTISGSNAVWTTVPEQQYSAKPIITKDENQELFNIEMKQGYAYLLNVDLVGLDFAGGAYGGKYNYLVVFKNGDDKPTELSASAILHCYDSEGKKWNAFFDYTENGISFVVKGNNVLWKAVYSYLSIVQEIA